jgi:NADPH-dependent 2,4-dienoyl-CoA reductase/sulfur reductase-like enzyme/rhodanese-related sulfurtransferase
MSANYLIIGGVAAGATAAAKIRRIDEHATITLLDRGPFVSFANCGLPYYISRDIEKRSSLLLQTPEGFQGRYRVNVHLETEVLSIDRERKEVLTQSPHGAQVFPYDKLLLAQGGTPFIPNLPGVNQSHVFKLWTIPDMDRIHGFIEATAPRHAVIAGGGFIGLEMAEALHARGLDVTLVELAEQVMAQMDPEFGAMIRTELEAKGVHVLTGVGLNSIQDNAIILTDGSSIPAEVVLLSIGVRPELNLAKQAGLEIGSAGGLVVDDYLRTSDPNIYAAGDMVEITHRILKKKVRIPLAGPANKQGRIVAENMLGAKTKYRGALGTSVVKVFDQTAAITGLSETAARRAGFSVGISFIHKDHHASYYPGATPLTLKLVYQATDGLLLGAEAFGKNGADKRIDVLATALHGHMTLADLAELDLAYAPPYSSAHDPVNMAAFVGLNHLSHFSSLKTAQETIEALQTGEVVLLDLRTLGEQSKEPIEGALWIPADEIRDRLNEIPRNVPLYLLSKDGALSHIVLRILVAEGFDTVHNIAGGLSAIRWF